MTGGIRGTRAAVINGVVCRVFAAHPNHKRIAAGAALIGVLTVVAKAFAAAREVTIAWRYGVGATADAYQLALTATTWVPMMLTGVMVVVLVPRLVKLDREAWERGSFVGELNASILLLGIAVAALTWLAAPGAARVLASDDSPMTLHLTATMTARMAPISLLVILSGYLFARLQSRERYSYTVTEAVPPLAIALFVIGQGTYVDGRSLILGTLVGYLVQVLILISMIARGDPPIGRMRWGHKSREWSTLYGSILLMVLGQFLVTASIPIDQGFASRLGEGSVASLGYANRVIGLFSGLATVVIGRALLPVLSRAAADGDLSLGRRQALQWSGMLFCVSSVGSAIVWIASPEIVRLLFERGEFAAASSTAVTKIFRFGLLQLPFYFAGIALVQWYAATSAFRSLLFISASALAIKLPLNFLLPAVFGVSGIMLSTAAMYAVTLFLMLLLIGRTSEAIIPLAARSSTSD